MILPRTMNRKLDSLLMTVIKNIEDTVKFHKDTDRLGSWARKWVRRFQPVKCNVMLLTNNGQVKFRILTNLRGTSVGKC